MHNYEHKRCSVRHITIAGAVDFGDAALSNLGAVQLTHTGDADEHKYYIQWLLM